ncbi:knotted carbamoyltransferase YgeW [Myxococcota bacterium]|nr:knotted carbamoyltransferase YgeW [Myxococcota bacterium]
MNPKAELNQLIDIIRKGNSDLQNNDFLLTWEHSPAAIESILATATVMERYYRERKTLRYFNQGLGISIFRDNSTRTRFAYASAANLLGLAVQDLDERTSQIAHGETVRETANMIAFTAEAVGIRDDMYIHEGHAYMKEVGAALDEGFEAGVLPQRPALVNLQSDLDHPTQSMSDLLHLANKFGGIENLRGKKIAMSWAYSPSYGKPLSVAQGTIGLLTRFGMDVTLAHPEGYDLLPDIVETAGKQAKESGGSFTHTHSMSEAFEGADIVYPKSWAPFQVMESRTKLLHEGATRELAELERTALDQNAQHKDWECNEEMMKKTKAGKALYMHCLPADITGVSCAAGEVAKDVFEPYRLDTYHEAAHKPYVIAAMILLARNGNTADFLAGIK